MTHPAQTMGIAELLRFTGHADIDGNQWCPVCSAENKLSIYRNDDDDETERVHCHDPDCDLDEDEFGLRKLLGHVPKGAFAMIPNDLLRDASLSIQARLLYGILVSYAWQDGFTFVGQETLAADMRLKPRQIRTYLGELSGRKLITSKRRGLTKTNVYVINKP